MLVFVCWGGVGGGGGVGRGRGGGDGWGVGEGEGGWFRGKSCIMTEYSWKTFSIKTVSS